MTQTPHWSEGGVETVEQARARYLKALHAMQSGVRAQMETPGLGRATEEKHLRVGINAAQRDSASIAMLLVRKGLITEAELQSALADGMEAEVADYERELSAHFKAPVKLT